MAGLTKSIAHNTLWQVLGKAVGTVLGLATIALLTRYLGSGGFGYYSTALAFMQFFGVLIDMGLYLVCLKEISATPENEAKIFNNILALRIASALLLLGGGSLLIFAFPYPDAVKWSAVIVAVSFLFMSLVQILTAVFQKYLKMGAVALAEVAGRAGFLIAVILFIYFHGNLTAIMWGNVVNALIYFLILWFLIKKYVAVKLAFDYAYWKIILRKTWPIAVGIAFNLVYFRADTIILSLYQPAVDVGIYSAPYKILEIIVTFPHMFMGLVMPILTAAWLAHNTERFKAAVQKTFDFFMMLALPMLLGSLPLADRIMRLLAGPDFGASGRILPILMLATAIIFTGILFTYILVILDQQKNMLKYYFSGAILSLIGYFVFIPRYSYFGAAWVTVAVELLIAISAFVLTYKFSQLKISLNTFWKTLAASLMMMAILYLLPAWPTIWLIIIGLAVYLIVMIMINAFDRQLIKELLNK